MTTYSTLVLPDGAKLAYEVLGSDHLERNQPIALICGMGSTRVDFERLTQCLIRSHPVLIYDHRGIGNSSLSPAGDEEISIEGLAHDLLALLVHLSWKEVALCGYSMGGLIAEQMLLFLYRDHTVKPASIPFRVTHLILAGTRLVVTANTGLKVNALAANITRTPEEKIEMARNVVKSLLDPNWVEENSERFERLFKRTINPNISRPTEIMVKQKLALQNFNVVQFDKIPKNIEVLVIHGRLDQVVPFHCGEETLRLIPWAKFVEQGDQPGQVPTLNFGHWWYEYFDIQVWHDVVRKFLS